MPKDIEPDILEKDSGQGEGSPKADKPLSPKATKDIPEVVKPPSLTRNEEAPGASQEDCPKDASPSLSPQAKDSGVASNAPMGEGSARLKVKEIPRPPP
jgi:hypothetical protein